MDLCWTLTEPLFRWRIFEALHRPLGLFGNTWKYSTMVVEWKTKYKKYFLLAEVLLVSKQLAGVWIITRIMLCRPCPLDMFPANLFFANPLQCEPSFWGRRRLSSQQVAWVAWSASSNLLSTSYPSNPQPLFFACFPPAFLNNMYPLSFSPQANVIRQIGALIPSILSRCSL